MTHLTSTCPTGGRAGPARTWPHFLCRSGPGGLGGPALPPDCPSGVRGRSPRPPAASPGPSPHCSSARHGPGPRSRSPPLAPGPPPQSRSNPAHPGGDALAASSLPGPRVETPRLPGLRPAAEGAGSAYRRRRRQRPLSTGAPTCGAEEPAGLWQAEQAAAAAQPGSRRKRRARARAAAAPGGGAGSRGGSSAWGAGRGRTGRGAGRDFGARGRDQGRPRFYCGRTRRRAFDPGGGIRRRYLGARGAGPGRRLWGVRLSSPVLHSFRAVGVALSCRN